MPYEPKNAYAYVHKIISERNNKPSPPNPNPDGWLLIHY